MGAVRATVSNPVRGPIRVQRYGPMVPAQCYERVVRLNVAGGMGSAFTIDRHDQQWLVTARHVVATTPLGDIQVVRRDGPLEVELEPVPSVTPAADVAVFRLSAPITPDLPLQPTSEGAVFSQDAYFLGYPYGLGLKTSGVVYPFVKKALISAFDRSVDDVALWFLDGINNPGFSGGPVVFNRSGTSSWQVAAVVSGYRTQPLSVRGGAGVVDSNTGIIVAYDIAHAVTAIDRFKSQS